jgi:hypothetical protein
MKYAMNPVRSISHPSGLRQALRGVPAALGYHILSHHSRYHTNHHTLLFDSHHQSCHTAQMALSKLDKHAQDIVSMIVRDITHTPDGYRWWMSLPDKGKRSRKVLQQRWVRYVTGLLDEHFSIACVQASLTPQGTIDDRGKLLAAWLLNHVYYSPAALLKAWLHRNDLYQHTLPTKKAS